MKEPENGGLGTTPEDIEEAVPYRYPGTPPSSPAEPEYKAYPTPYPNPKPEPRARIAQTLPSGSTPTLPPFISSSTESRSSNSPRDQMTHAQAGALYKQKQRWYTEFSLPFYSKMKMHLEWMPANFTYPKLKPVIRSAVVSWTCVLLFVFPAFERAMGQASFVILIGEFDRECFMWLSGSGCTIGGTRIIRNVEWRTEL